jgi:PhnB protein
MELSAHLTFDGRCEAAFQFYERVLDAKIDFLLRYGDSPMAEQTPPEWRSKVVHASLKIGDGVLAGADILPDQYERPQGFYVLLSPNDPLVAERMFKALADHGTVRMPLKKTFWSPAFGVLVDQFGIPWEISCEQESVEGRT